MGHRTDQPPDQPSLRTCTSCGGQTGFPDTTPLRGGGQITVFRPCTACHGTGTRGGGI